MSTRLTFREQCVWKRLKGTSNIIRSYHCPNGQHWYRMVDSTARPVMNIRKRNLQKLINLGRVIVNEKGQHVYNPKWHGNNQLERA